LTLLYPFLILHIYKPLPFISYHPSSSFDFKPYSLITIYPDTAPHRHLVRFKYSKDESKCPLLPPLQPVHPSPISRKDAPTDPIYRLYTTPPPTTSSPNHLRFFYWRWCRLLSRPILLYAPLKLPISEPVTTLLAFPFIFFF
jgi:hypothetical protein